MSTSTGLQLTRHGATAEDLVQDVFIRLLKKAGSFRGTGSFKAWLFNVARNVAFDHLRKAKRQNTLTGNDEALAAQLVDGRSAEDSAGAAERLDHAAEALARLPDAAREVIWLGRFEFEGYEELAQALGCKPGAARVRMHRAMSQLSEIFEQIHGATGVHAS